jgi:hypothetical protein
VGHDDITEIYADLGGVQEVAVALGVSIYRVKRWIERRPNTNCPLPVRSLKCGHVYSIAEWRGWMALWQLTHANTGSRK